MECTLDHALQQGIAAHRQGNLQEAERIYSAILQSQPGHADANHNLGVIAVSVNKVALALPLFKTALEANPKVEQFWLSYVNALIKENQLEIAKKVFEDARKVGLFGDKVDALEAQLKQMTQSAPLKLPEKKKSLTLGEKRKKNFESKQQKKQVKSKNAYSVGPSQQEISKLLKYYENKQYIEAEKLATSITQKLPNHDFGWKVLGAVFLETGRKSEALDANQIAVQLAPQDASAHSNLGNTLKELGRLEEAEGSYRKAIALERDFAEAYSNLGNTLKELGRLEEAEGSYRQAINLKTDFAKAHNNLGNLLQSLSRLGEAEGSYRQAIALKTNYAEAHNNLGITLQTLGRLEESEVSCRQALALKPDFAEANNSLCITLQELGRLEEAEASCRQALALKPDYAHAHNNLANTLQKLGRLDEAEASFKQAIMLKSDDAGTHNNLGNTLKELGRLEDAEKNYRQAIMLKPDFAEPYGNLAKTLYIQGYKQSALESMEKANEIDPQSKEYRLLLNVMKSRHSRQENEGAIVDTSNMDAFKGLTSNPLILNRVVEPELRASLYGMSSRELDKTKVSDARYGSGTCSVGYDLFEDTCSIIKTLTQDLTKIMKEAVKSDIFIFDSFFNILGAGGGSIPHKHLNKLDEDIVFDLGKQKYSLVYYLSVGDQNCCDPGILRLYDPGEEILPLEGMIVIIPSSRKHSAVYGGRKDRIMIGVNFYSL